MAAVLHGHEHIPRFAETPTEKIPVFGCGSSVGKVKTRRPNETCISVNVVSLDPGRQSLTGRLLAEHVIGTDFCHPIATRSCTVGEPIGFTMR